MRFCRHLLLYLALTLILFGISACTRTRTPWPERPPLKTPPLEASPGEALPRYTPHVTSPPTITPTFIPPTIQPPTPTQPSPSPSPVSGEGSGVYIVQPGDTLYDIAQDHHVSLQELAELNGITDPSIIFVKMKLLIP